MTTRTERGWTQMSGIGHKPVARFMWPGRVRRLMRVRATLHGFEPKERELDLPAGAKADDAPRACGIRPELVLVFRANAPIAGDEPLREGDHVRIVRVVSGG